MTDTFEELITVDSRKDALAIREMLNLQGIEDVHVWPALEPGPPDWRPWLVLVTKEDLLQAKRLVRNSDLKIVRRTPPPLDGQL